MGASDTILILNRKNRGDTETKLSMVGRDIRQDDLIITFDNTKYRWEVVGTAEEEEHRIVKNEYESNPVVKTIKALMTKNPWGWKGSATDLIKECIDLTGQMYVDSSTGVGRTISNYETMLYADGIRHEAKKSGANRSHYFSKTDYKSWQQRMPIIEKEDE